MSKTKITQTPNRHSLKQSEGDLLWFQKGNSSTTKRFTSFGWLFTYFLGLSFIFLLSTTNQDGFANSLNYVSILSLLIIALSSAMISFSLSREVVQVVSSLFWMFQYIFFGITGYSLSLDQNPMYMGRLVTGNGYEKASLFILVSILLVAIVQTHFYKNKFGFSQNHEMTPKDLLQVIHRIKILNILYLFVAPIAINQLGGLQYLFKSGSRSTSIKEPNLALFGIYEAIVFVVPILVFIVHFILKNAFDFRVNKVWFTSNLIWVLVLSNPVSFARQTALFMLLAIFFLIGKQRTRITQFTFMVLPIMILVFGNFVNRYNGSINFKFELTPASRILDLDAYPVFANGLEKISSETFPFLNQILGSIFFYIPRSIWESKPIDTGALLAQYSGLRFQNLSAPWVLEAYVNGREIGLIIISVLLGIFLARIEPNYFDFKRHIQGAVIAGSTFILLRGSLLQATGRVLFSLLLIQFICMNLGRNSQIKNNLQEP